MANITYSDLVYEYRSATRLLVDRTIVYTDHRRSSSRLLVDRTIVYTNNPHQPATNLPMVHRSVYLPIVHYPQEETAIIGGPYNYRPHRLHSYNQRQPTYEENLELEEQMGRVDSRLSEETIMRHLKIRSCDATSKRMDEEADICVICQGEYEKDELIGGLQCRHEYHVECVKKWLQQHNSCPICKAAAVSPNGCKF